MLTLLLSYLAPSLRPRLPLGDALSDSIFYSFGVAHANSTYAYVPFSVSYMEPDNISTPNTGWGVGKYEYLYEVVNPAPAAACASPPMIPYDVPCCDFGEVVLDEDDVTVCASLCCGKPGCTGFTYEPASDGSFGGCIPGKPCCYMKNGWAAPVAKPAGFRILSANVTSGAQFVAPALGCALRRRWAACPRGPSSCARMARFTSGSSTTSTPRAHPSGRCWTTRGWRCPWGPPRAFCAPRRRVTRRGWAWAPSTFGVLPAYALASPGRRLPRRRSQPLAARVLHVLSGGPRRLRGARGRLYAERGKHGALAPAARTGA